MKKNNPIDLILEIYKKRNISNRKYSLNAFARDIKISKASLIQVLNGKRELTAKTLLKIIENIPHSLERKQLLNFAEKMTAPLRVQKFNDKERSLFGDWRFFVILIAVEILDQAATIENVSNLTSISKKKIKELLPVLIALDQLELDGILLRKNTKTTVRSEIPSELILKHHIESIHLSSVAIKKGRDKNATFHSLTLGIEQARVDKVNELTEKYIKSVLKELQKHNVDTVYKLNTQLFPVSKKNGSK